jgi:Holliday junction resolvase RusA-like endonuclease
MDLIKEGWLFKKTTRPDLPDNLKKLPLDSMADLVFKDDALIWQECNTTKVFGTGGCIIIKMKGR